MPLSKPESNNVSASDIPSRLTVISDAIKPKARKKFLDPSLRKDFKWVPSGRHNSDGQPLWMSVPRDQCN